MPLQNLRIGKQSQTHKGRVALRGDVVNNDSGSYAVFTEQGSSAWHMTAAKVLDAISRLSGCAGQASNAVSAHTQVKMEDANVIGIISIRVPSYLDSSTKIPPSEIMRRNS